jgi:hypothetical protein
MPSPDPSNFEARQEDREPERFGMFGTTFRGSHVVRSPAGDDAERHIWQSLLTAAVVPLLVLILLIMSHVTMLWTVMGTAISAYVAWTSYWGIVGVSDILTDITAGRSEEELPWYLKFVKELIEEGFHTEWAVPLVAFGMGVLYGVLGGGLYQFLKHRKIASNPDAR